MYNDLRSFGFDESIITLIKVERGRPSHLCLPSLLHFPAGILILLLILALGLLYGGTIHFSSYLFLSSSVVAASSPFLFISKTFTFQEQSLSKWHQYRTERPLKAPQPLLPPIIERDEKEAEEKKKTRWRRKGVTGWFVQCAFPQRCVNLGLNSNLHFI